jgi:hypothetical protein
MGRFRPFFLSAALINPSAFPLSIFGGPDLHQQAKSTYISGCSGGGKPN